VDDGNDTAMSNDLDTPKGGHVLEQAAEVVLGVGGANTF
jgi:hypothetical protein